MTLFTAGLLLGLAGGGHCLAMCGPLVLAIGPRQTVNGRRQLSHVLLYHAGRLTTYMMLALPAAMLGRLLSLQGLGRAAAMAGALALLLMAFDSRLPWLRRLERPSSSRIAAGAWAAAARWRLAHPVAGTAAAGAAHGLIPCGMVYAAVAAALASGSMTGAVVMVAGFGLGTVLPLAALSFSAASVPTTWRQRLERATPAVLVLAAGLLLLRGFSAPLTPAGEPSPHVGHVAPRN